MNKQNSKNGVIGMLLFCTGVGALKGLISGLRRTSLRRESENFIEDGGPVISNNDDFLTLIGSTGVIVTSSTIAGSIQGLCVGVMSPIVIPCGLYHYCQNYMQNRNEVIEQQVDESIEISETHSL